MDNSLQDFAGSFTFGGMKYKLRSAIASAVLAAATLIPTTASANEVCVGATCTVTFEFTGSSQVFSVPQGVSGLSFEVFGAAGARGGGGGSVSGSFSVIPATLRIYIGGSGNLGSGASGGYNGGGNAGSHRGNEGSGGGASDIRTGTSLESRIIVAGGGGGGGGFSGAPGAPGGGVTAAAGGSGQGGGGGGGGVSSGGAPGPSNGGSSASWGTFGLGGSGGSSWLAGGGGGGGGWYGGGGGGADGDDCCSDGGGGGGGSSYANASITQSVQHTAGVQAGNGRIQLRYTILPEVVSFSGIQVSSNLSEFYLQMSLNIAGLTREDFELFGTGCQIKAVSTSGASALIVVTGCRAALISIRLAARSVGDSPFGPSAPASATLVLDQEGPSFRFGDTPTLISSSEIVIPFTHDQSTTAVNLQMFDFPDCSYAELVLDAISLSGCVTGNHVVRIRAESLSDEFGNLGPSANVLFYFEIDRVTPYAFWSEVSVTGTGPFSISAVLSLSEPVSFDPESVSLVSDTLCPLVFQQVSSGWLYSTTCGYGEGRFELAAESLIDQVGLSGPALVLTRSFSNPAPVALVPAPATPALAQQQIPEQQTTQPQPNPPVQSIPGPPSTSEPVLVAQTISPEAAVPIRSPSPTQSSEGTASELGEAQAVSNPGVLEIAIDSALEKLPVLAPDPGVAESGDSSDSQPLTPGTAEPTEVLLEADTAPLSQEVAGPALEIEPQEQSFWPWLFAGIAGFVLLAGLGFWRFSGR